MYELAKKERKKYQPNHWQNQNGVNVLYLQTREKKKDEHKFDSLKKNNYHIKIIPDQVLFCSKKHFSYLW
jgi:hypothetical protein